METMPILHAGQVFTIHFEDDFTFSEVRGVLDYLLQERAFTEEVQQNRIEYFVEFEDVAFAVWVWEMNVAIQRR